MANLKLPVSLLSPSSSAERRKKRKRGKKELTHSDIFFGKGCWTARKRRSFPTRKKKRKNKKTWALSPSLFRPLWQTGPDIFTTPCVGTRAFFKPSNGGGHILRLSNGDLNSGGKKLSSFFTNIHKTPFFPCPVPFAPFFCLRQSLGLESAFFVFLVL